MRASVRTKALWHEVLSATYATCARPVAMARIARCVRTGTVDERLAVALRSLFDAWPWRGGQVAEVARQVERRRAELSRRPGHTVILGAGGKPRQITAPRLAYYSSVPPRWGRFLFHCAEAARARTIVEVGACIGISGSYLAAAPSCRTFVTFEPCTDLADMAAASIRQLRPESHVVPRPFDEGLDSVASLLENGVDLVYIDSSHDAASTVDPAMRLLPSLRPGGIVLLDDIRWSPSMWQNWQTVRHHAGIALTIDLGRMGLCLWGGGEIRPRHHDLSRLLGSWRVETRNTPAAPATPGEV